MTTTAIRLLVVLFACAAVPCRGAGAQTAPDPPLQQKASQSSLGEVSPDIARIRKSLNEQQSPPASSKLVLTDRAPTPTFRVQVFGYERPFVLSLAEQIAADKAESLWASVPPVADVEEAVLRELQDVGSDLQVLHPINAIQAARRAWYRHKVAKIRQEVAAELEAFKARQAEPAAAPKAPKKQP